MHFPLSTHPHAELAALAAEAAGKQGKFWQLHDLLFKETRPFTPEIIKSLAQTLFNKKQMAQFEKDLEDPMLKQKVKAHKEYGANDLRLSATPTFFFNGRPYNLSSAKDGFGMRLAMEQARGQIACEKAKK